jgi:hypothetical protein
VSDVIAESVVCTSALHKLVMHRYLHGCYIFCGTVDSTGFVFCIMIHVVWPNVFLKFRGHRSSAYMRGTSSKYPVHFVYLYLYKLYLMFLRGSTIATELGSKTLLFILQNLYSILYNAYPTGSRPIACRIGLTTTS